MNKNEQQDSGAEVAAWVIGKTIRLVFMTLRTFAVTIAWLIALWGLSSLGVAGTLLGIALIVGVLAWPESRRYGPFVSDYARWTRRRAKKAQSAEGNHWLRQVGLVREDDESVYPVRRIVTDAETRIVFDQPIPGMSHGRLTKVGEDYRALENAKRVRVDDLANGALALRFVRVSATDEPTVIDKPVALDPDRMSTVLGVDEDGEPFHLALANSTSAILGGVPGSGKTGALSSWLSAFAVSDDVRLTIIDGKGGDDLTPFEPVADTFIQASSFDLTPVVDCLEAARVDMEDRFRTNKDLFGVSSFWEASIEQRRAAGRRFHLLVLDECQEFFDLTGADKDEKEVKGRLTKLCTDLIKRGRSAGIFLVFVTQKPTAESLPTSIRDNCSIRAALRVTTKAAEDACLGESSDSLETVSASAIPSDEKGSAVIVDPRTGERIKVRFYFFPERDLRDYLDSVGKVRNLREQGVASQAA